MCVIDNDILIKFIENSKRLNIKLNTFDELFENMRSLQRQMYKMEIENKKLKSALNKPSIPRVYFKTMVGANVPCSYRSTPV